MKTYKDLPHARPGRFVLVAVLCLATAGRAVAEPPKPEDVVAVLTELRGQMEWPGLTVAEAAANLGTPQEALRFVSDEVVLVNYRGAYADPEAVLRTRVANATDKSGLLVALLTEMGVEARLVRGDWPQQAQPHQGPGPQQPLPAMEKLAALLTAEDVTADSLPDGPDDEQLKELQDEINASAAAIEQYLAAADRADLLTGIPDPEDVPPGRTDTDWVWVQAQLDGQAWTDMDAVFPAEPRPDDVTTAFAPEPVTISIRLEACRFGEQEAETVLQWTGPCGDVLGYDLLISYFPEGGDLQEAEQPENVARWQPQLTAGPLKVAGEPFAPSGGPAEDVAAEAEPAPAGGLGGFGGLGGGEPATAPATTGSDFLRLVIEIDDPAGPWSRSFSRVVQYIGEGYDPHELIAFHRIGLGMAFAPVRVVESRMVDEAIDAYQLRQLADGEIDQLPDPRGVSTRTTRVLNTLLFLKTLAVPPELGLAWQGPALFVETAQLRKTEDDLYVAGRLDTLHEAFGPAQGSSRRHRMLWGLATCAVEAHMLGGPSVNHRLLAAGETLRVLEEPDSPDDAMAASVLAEGGLLLASSDAPESIWAVRPTGDVLGLFIEPHPGLEAKGAGRTSRSRTAGNVYAGLGGAAMGLMSSPAAMLVGPLHAYFEELAEVSDGSGQSVQLGNRHSIN